MVLCSVEQKAKVLLTGKTKVFLCWTGFVYLFIFLLKDKMLVIIQEKSPVACNLELKTCSSTLYLLIYCTYTITVFSGL